MIDGIDPGEEDSKKTNRGQGVGRRFTLTAYRTFARVAANKFQRDAPNKGAHRREGSPCAVP